MSNDETTQFAGSSPAMRTNFAAPSEGDNPLDFIGDCAAFVFITNLRFLLTIPEAFLIGQL